MKKRKTLIIAAILVIATLIAAIFAGCVHTPTNAEASLEFDGLASKPTQEAIAKSTPVDKDKIALSETVTEDKAVLDSIEYLLRLSNKNLIETDFFAAGAFGYGTATINGGTIVGSMQTREVRVFDNDTYYFDSYGLIVDGYTVKKDGSHGKVDSSILSVLSSALNYTKRVYSPNGKDFYFSDKGSTNQNTIVNFPDQNAVIYKKPKAKKMTYNEYMKMTNSRESYKSFTTDNYDNDKPITAGKLTYNADAGIYRLECDINCKNNTLENSVKDMLDISAIKEFEYAKKHLTIEIWECGLIRTYVNANLWNANMILSLKGSSDNYYEQWFTYDKSKLDKMNISDNLKNALMK
ncbi:MAG: hypothetical protein K2M75_04025 [Clostridia bacterium]|nr:hypothetical protein [Clostridia bacterium]